MRDVQGQRGRRLAPAIFIAVFGAYLLSSGREPAWSDARPMWEVAERIVQHGAIDIQTHWPEDIPPGEDGKVYGIAPIGPALVHAPGAAINGITHHFAPSYTPLVRPLSTHLAPAALGALACVLFFWFLLDLGRSVKVASTCTAILAFATTTWVYARYPYSEILQLACFLGMFRATWRVIEMPTRREAIWLGVWAGCLLNSKSVFALAIAGAAFAIAWSLRGRSKRVLAWAALAGAPFAVLALWYDYARWGSPLETGYGPYLGAFFGGSVIDGAWGMLASPNKSALLYSPPLVLAIAAMPAMLRAHRRLGLLLATVALPTLLVYCTYRSWSGEWAWGPRFFVWVMPVALVPLAWFFDTLTRRKKMLLGIAISSGVCVQLLGNGLYWDHFIRLAGDAKNQWLGNPDRRGAYVPEHGRGHCDSCFEDTYELMWLPAFNPIRGHFWLIESLAEGDTAAEAQANAPWRRYTSLDTHLEANYGRVRVDWWGLLWLKDATGTWPLGLALLLVFTGMTAGGAIAWRRRHSVRDTDDAQGRARSDQ